MQVNAIDTPMAGSLLGNSVLKKGFIVSFDFIFSLPLSLQTGIVLKFVDNMQVSNIRIQEVD